MSDFLQPHQQEALYQAKRDTPRGILSMCPRSGKTRVICKLCEDWHRREGGGPRVSLILVPTLDLLRQFFIQDWLPMVAGSSRRATAAGFLGSISKCQVEGVTKLQTQEDVVTFCARSGLIVSTFHSAHKVFAAIDSTTCSFLFVVDEAHLFVDTFALAEGCVAKQSRAFVDQIQTYTDASFENKSEGGRQHRARFFTGTPVEARSETALMVEEDLGYVMNNEQKFGSKLYTWSYKDALEEDSLCAFSVAVLETVLPPEDIAANLQRIHDSDTCKMFPLVELIDFAFLTYKVRHLLVYVQSSQEAYDLQRFMEQSSKLNIHDTDRDDPRVFLGSVYTGTPNGDHTLSQGLRERQRTIQSFRDATLGILINIQILSIGVTLPEVDAIMLTSPSVNESLIRQRIFRALQKRPDTPDKIAWVFLPALQLVVEEGRETVTSFDKEIRVMEKMKTEYTNSCHKLRGTTSERWTRSVSRRTGGQDTAADPGGGSSVLDKKFHLHSDMTQFLAAVLAPPPRACQVDTVGDLACVLRTKGIEDWAGLQTLCKGDLDTWKVVNNPLETFGGEWVSWNHLFKHGSTWRQASCGDQAWPEQDPDELRHAMLRHIYAGLKETVRKLPRELRPLSEKDYKRKVRNWLREAMQDEHKFDLVKELPFYPEVLFRPIGFAWSDYLGMAPEEVPAPLPAPVESGRAPTNSNREIIFPGDILHTVRTANAYLEHKHNGKWINFFTFDSEMEERLMALFEYPAVEISVLKDAARKCHHCVMVKLCGGVNIKVVKKPFDMGFHASLTSVYNKTVAERIGPLLLQAPVKKLLQEVYELVDKTTSYTYET